MNNSNVININKNTEESGLNATIRSAITQYLDDLGGENPGNIYDLVMQQVEAPLLELVLKHVDGNQSKAAQHLGINRGTLRKKLKIYQLIK